MTVAPSPKKRNYRDGKLEKHRPQSGVANSIAIVCSNAFCFSEVLPSHSVLPNTPDRTLEAGRKSCTC